MDVIITGGLVRFVQGFSAAANTLIVGLFVAALLRYYVGATGTRRLFGGDGIRSLVQSWLIGMLLPVCSIGVIPILREMKRMGLRPGAITAFALSAPLFNPLSLLYGLTLSRPYVILGFAFASLAVVTILGTIWDRWTQWSPTTDPEAPLPVGLGRLGACAIYMCRELFGPTGILTLVALSGLLLLGMILPHGALQSSVEQLNPLAPLTMAIVSIPVYAPPMLTMSQLGMMFDHGNSPGASFCLLLLGTGINLATLVWVAANYGVKSTAIWFGTLMSVVLLCAYAIDRPLIPPGVEPAGHTHAFDIYTNPFHSGNGVSIAMISEALQKTIGVFDLIGIGLVAIMLMAGWVLNTPAKRHADRFVDGVLANSHRAENKGLNREVSPTTVGATCLLGLFAFSIVGCYAFYPSPDEVFEEMKIASVEVQSGVTANDYERVLHWIPILEEWTRKLEVGYAIRSFELRPFQKMQTYLLRKKLEELEHAAEHILEDRAAKKQSAKLASAVDAQQPGADPHLQEAIELKNQIFHCNRRLRAAFGNHK